MSVKIAELMADKVITANPHHSVDHLRGLMEHNNISAVPIVDTEGAPVGIVTSTDLVSDHKGGTPVSQFMAEGVASVPQYNDASVAARIMRKRKIHHVLVTHEKQVVGIISSFDLLKLVEDHKFVLKNAKK
jgi:CBS domain-containing protein